MSGRYRLAVIIPCLNEAGSVGGVVERYRRLLPDALLCVVDNGSDDGTGSAASAAGALVLYEERRGKGMALARGLRDIEAELYLIADGDGESEPQTALAMLERMTHGVDMVTAVRRTGGEGTTKYRPGHHAGNKLFVRLIKALFGSDTRDIFSGYRLLSRRLIRSWPMSARGYNVEMELTLHALRLGARVEYVDTPYRPRQAGTRSGVNTIRDGIKVLLKLISMYQAEKPIPFYWGIGLLFAAAGLIFGWPQLLQFINTGRALGTASASLAAALELLAFLMAVTGVINYNINRCRLEQVRLAYAREGTGAGQA